MLPNEECHEEDKYIFWWRRCKIFILKTVGTGFWSGICYLLNLTTVRNILKKLANFSFEDFTSNSEKILLDLAANQLKWQHCWPQAYAFCCVTAQKESNKNFWTQRSTEKLRLLLMAIFAKYWLDKLKKNLKKNKQDLLQRTAGFPKARGPQKARGPLKRGAVAIATFATIVNPALVGGYFRFEDCPECFCGPLKTLWRVTCGPRASICPPLLYGTVHRRMIAKDWSEWRWTFSFSCVENWLLLRSLECVEQNIWIHFSENTRPVWYSINM